MALYRYQAVSVGWWRGKIKRWNTTFHGTTSGLTKTVRDAMRGSGYPAPGDEVGACSGGLASITVYNAAGGVPISQTIYFDWQTPSEWIPYTGGGWASVDPSTPLDAAGESALLVTAKMPGLSTTGKPFFVRKYLHAIPSRTGPTYEDPDVPAAVQTAIKALFPATIMYSPRGSNGGAGNVEPWYVSHQRVRGRRRPVNQVAGQAFSLGVLAGGGATTSGQGEPFPGGEF